MKMQMMYSLSGIVSAVVDNAEAVIKLHLFGESCGNLKNMSHNCAVGFAPREYAASG